MELIDDSLSIPDSLNLLVMEVMASLQSCGHVDKALLEARSNASRERERLVADVTSNS
jgi:hypothetical protein